MDESPADRSGTRQLHDRLRQWVADIGYWGQAANVVVGESVATDYFPPQTSTPFAVGALRFNCVQDEATGDFRVTMPGSRFRHIADLATLHRAIAETGARPTPG
ncbi:hypothetical protein SAMN04515671_1752 [Nakamurella panacisegetis]|uniref:Uncharacterized protein n=1 Tax=Nakamurella panacisegetis TaxID=1090615 RepID=A0A1H0LPL6_9ACTN|nr:hypothetical protein [Nakamurella panacisegetis]SDO70199.1 hypothetical protein SAMN04515671_1752 [Nakamurella panacisegetis]